MIKRMKDISIVIPTYNTKDLTIQCIQGILDYHEGLDYEVIVVDDFSSDGTYDELKKLFNNIIIIRNKSNKGYCYSNNVGIKESSGKYIVILNSDVIFVEPVFYKMIEFMEENTDAGFATIKLVNKDLSTQYSCRSFPSLKFGLVFSLMSKFIAKNINSYRKYYMLDMDYTKTQTVDMASATCCIFPNSLIDDIGMMDERYFMYVGDSEWYYRASKKGYKFFFMHSPKIIHLGSQSTKISNNKFLLREYAKGFELFFRDHMMDEYNFFLQRLILIGLKIRHTLLIIRATFFNTKIGNIGIRK